MARSTLFHTLRRQLLLHDQARATGRSVEEVREVLERAREVQAARGISRRQVLTGMAATGALVATSGLLSRSARAAQPRVAIVGAGLAGLSAAVTLRDAGYAVTIYEASTDRVGGRAISDRGSAQNWGSTEACSVCHEARGSRDDGFWDDNQVSDIYGELIDTLHTNVQSMATRFGCTLVDSFAAQPAGSTDTYYFNEGYYTQAQADSDLGGFYSALHKDLTSAPFPTLWNTTNASAIALDKMSLYDWIESRIPGGHSSSMGKLIDCAYVIEYGAETTDQSALNMLYLLGYTSRRTFSVFGDSDERYRIAGGVGQLPMAMAEYLGWDASIAFGHWLVAISKNSDGSYTLVFDKSGGGTVEVVADYVLLAFPFTALRFVDYGLAGFDSRKDMAIQQQGGGVNGKLNLQFTRRLWNEAGPWGLSTGSSFSETGYQASWEATRGDPGTHAILAVYTGGNTTLGLRQKHPYGNVLDSNVAGDAATVLAQLEKVYPGITALWNGRAAGSMAHADPRFYSSYAYYKVGQTTQIAGYEKERQGNVFFAGEHTSVDWLGYLDGAVGEGVRAGSEMVTAMAGKTTGRGGGKK